MIYKGKTYEDDVIIDYCKRKLYRNGNGGVLNTLSSLNILIDEEDSKVWLCGEGDGKQVDFEFTLTEILKHILNKKIKKVKNF